jgi:TetR/AcrR family transcriptional regulator, cholesterol catabolism regulator
MPENSPSQAHEQVLRVAERLFRERGYAFVTMRDIADVLGIRQASLYYHAPEGKEQLFVEVTKLGLTRHHGELEQVVAQAEQAIAIQLHAVAFWLLSQVPIEFTRFFHTDLPALSKEHAVQLADLARWGWLVPLEHVFTEAYARGEIRLVDEKLMAISFMVLVESIHDMHRYTNAPKEVLARSMIEILLDGILRR